MTWSTVDDLEDWTQITLVQIGRFVRDMRRARGLTQVRVAERSGLSQSAISRLENGRSPGLRIAWYARVLVGMQEGIGPAGEWRRRWSSELREQLIDDFGPDGWLRHEIVESEIARQERVAHLMQP